MPKKPASGARKRVRRKPEQARSHILEAAVRVFAKSGPQAVGLKEVAEEAGVSHALITHYFGTYEALVDASVLAAMSNMRSRLIARIMAAPDPTPEAMVLLYIDIALEPANGRLVSWALFNDHAGTASYADRIVPDMKLIAAATEYMLARRLKPAPTRSQAEALLVTVWSLVIGYVAANGFFWRALGRKPGPQRDRDLRNMIVTITRTLFKEDGTQNAEE